MIHPLLIFLVLCSTAVSAFFGMFQLFFLVQCECLGIAQESRKKQASPRVDVDEAPYAPGNDLLYVTELDNAHDSIKLLISDGNLEFFYTETLPMPDSDETSGQCNKICLDDTFSAQLIAGIITCQFENDLSSVRKSRSRTQQYSASGWSWVNLRLCKAFEREKMFKCLF